MVDRMPLALAERDLGPRVADEVKPAASRG